MKRSIRISDFSGERLDGNAAEITVRLSDGRRARLDLTDSEAREILARASIRRIPSRGIDTASRSV